MRRNTCVAKWSARVSGVRHFSVVFSQLPECLEKYFCAENFQYFVEKVVKEQQSKQSSIMCTCHMGDVILVVVSPVTRDVSSVFVLSFINFVTFEVFLFIIFRSKHENNVHYCVNADMEGRSKCVKLIIILLFLAKFESLENSFMKLSSRVIFFWLSSKDWKPLITQFIEIYCLSFDPLPTCGANEMFHRRLKTFIQFVAFYVSEDVAFGKRSLSLWHIRCDEYWGRSKFHISEFFRRLRTSFCSFSRFLKKINPKFGTNLIFVQNLDSNPKAFYEAP